MGASSVRCRRFNSSSGFNPPDACRKPSGPLPWGTKLSPTENHYYRHTCWFYTAGLKVDPTQYSTVWCTSPVFVIWSSKATQRHKFGGNIYIFPKTTIQFWGNFRETLKLALGFWIGWLIGWSIDRFVHSAKLYWAPATCRFQCWWHVCCCAVLVAICSELVGSKPAGRPVKKLLGEI